ncbi:MAG TPA: hypothetical protein VE442_22000 [Jatrophihabitans sp.]|jgi:predicted RNA-binding Zn-ribbon protein involved in translation (DUF1610 family)|nr:hypothetical protein [Jatrophihabitans sp.]
MSIKYVCDSCGYRGVAHDADTADQVQCEMCGEPVLEDLDRSTRYPPRSERRGPAVDSD